MDFARVDASRQAQTLVDGMDATTRWPAVRQLRAWERDRLALVAGETLLDVGCGPGDAGVALVAGAGGTARLVGIDASERMLAVARERAAAAGVAAEFRVGDAAALPEPDGSVDALRSERMLQWVPDPDAALREFVRVLRPGGRLVVIDTDWNSLTIDLPDLTAFRAAQAAMQRFRGGGFTIGRELLNRCRDAGLRDVAGTAATHLETVYETRAALEVTGFPPLQQGVRGLVRAGELDSATAERLLAEVDEAGRSDRMMLSLTMYAVFGVKP